MAYAPHYLLNLSGELNDDPPGEIWSCGIRGDFLGPDTDVDDFLDALAGPLNTWYASTAAHMSTFSHLSLAKLNQITSDGTYDSLSITHEHIQDADGAVATSAPSFLSVCWSWTTSAMRGYGSKGRNYFPTAIGGRVNNASSYLTTAEQNLQLAGAVGLIEMLLSVSTDSGSSFLPGIFSSHGEHNPITGARVGSVIDVQRRRKNALPEVYVSGAIG